MHPLWICRHDGLQGWPKLELPDREVGKLMGGFKRKKKEHRTKMVANSPFSSPGVWEPPSEDQGTLIAALSFRFLKPKYHS